MLEFPSLDSQAGAWESSQSHFSLLKLGCVRFSFREKSWQAKILFLNILFEKLNTQNNMADTRTKEKRSEIMSKVRSKHTAPEMLVRRLIFSMGYRYRLHVKGLPGKPDIVMIGRRKVIDVRGCFWHGHEGCKYGRLPKSRQDFWAAKIARNYERDLENFHNLERNGWRVLVVWQCQLKNLKLLKTRLYEFIESE